MILDHMNKHSDEKSEDIYSRQKYEEEKGPSSSNSNDSKDIEQLKTIMLNSGLQIINESVQN